ncbi:MAG: hypothetical protein PHW04_13430 [Candidatus Wallbacteria bacterium]|nr:hypothetical protein [Candidatus Wallbacteria bacterium]
MFNDKDFRKRVFLRIMAEPASLYPSLGGLSLLLLQWGFNVGEPVVTFLGLGSLIIGSGMFGMNLLSSTKFAERVFEDMRTEELEGKEHELDILDQELRKDNDARDENLLCELRNLNRLLNDKALCQKKISSITYNVNELYDHCVGQLRTNLNLRDELRLLDPASKAYEVIRDQRERIIGDIGQTVENLRDSLTKLLAMDGEDEEKFVELNNDLADTLEIARKVDLEMEGLKKGEGIRRKRKA